VRKEAEQEETDKTKALEKVRQELADAHGKQTDRLQLIVDRLEAELKDALERKAKAIAREQLTRSGHIYVLSNVGSLGEGIYKIGMTRRLEPLKRVKELGDASVPFRFDVHAMVYSEDSPSIESLTGLSSEKVALSSRDPSLKRCRNLASMKGQLSYK